MKIAKYLSGLLIALFIFETINAQSKQNSVSKDLLLEFQKDAEKWKAAYNSGDAKNFMPLYAEDARYLSGHVNGLEAVGRDKVIANFQNGMRGGGHVDNIEIISADLSCEMATLLTKYQATNSGTTVVGRNLLVLRKVKGKWVIVLHMTVV